MSSKEMKELKKIEKEIKQTELQESLDTIENRRNFNLGLSLGLVFAIIGGFFSIIMYELFVRDLPNRCKIMLALFSFILLVVFLIIGIIENKQNKKLKTHILRHTKK